MCRGSLVEDAVWAMIVLAEREDFSNDSGVAIRKANLFKDGKVFNLSMIETSRYISLSHTNKDSWGVLAPHFLESLQNLFGSIGHRAHPFDVNMNIVKFGLIHGRAVVTLDS